VEIYKLTGLGDALAHNIRPANNSDRWRVIYYLANGAKEKKDIVEHTGASSYTLAYLAQHKVIVGGQSVLV
jgi:hypothetical protein